MTDPVYQMLQEYLNDGVRLLPLHSIKDGHCDCWKGAACDQKPGKHPWTTNGSTGASDDPAQVWEWARMYPGCNWGGRPLEGAFVVDEDPKNDGDVALEQLQEKYGRLPATLTALTGSGGHHFWFRGTVSKAKLVPGVDIKTPQGYLVLPPSIHESGRNYEWIDYSPIAWAPEWLQKLLNPPVMTERLSYAGTAEGLVETLLVRAENGERNKWLYWCACRAVEGDLPLEPLIEAAITLGLDPSEAHKTAHSALRAPARTIDPAKFAKPTLEQFVKNENGWY